MIATILAIILPIAFCGFLAWLVLQIPMPAVFKNVIIGVLCLVLVLYVLQMFGVDTGFRAVRLR